MAAATDFNVGAGVKAARKLLKTYVNVGTSELPEWELVGRGIEESAIELNPNVETMTDILGFTDTSVTKWEPKQTFEPNTVKGGSKLNFKLHDIWINKQPEKLSQFEVLIVYNYIAGSTVSTYVAEKQTECTINLTSIGGSAYVDMPIEIMYSNKTTRGTVAYTSNAPTFTADVAA